MSWLVQTPEFALLLPFRWKPRASHRVINIIAIGIISTITTIIISVVVVFIVIASIVIVVYFLLPQYFIEKGIPPLARESMVTNLAIFNSKVRHSESIPRSNYEKTFCISGRSFIG